LTGGAARSPSLSLDMKRILPFLIVIAVGAATVTGGTLLYRAKRPVQLTMTEDAGASAEHTIGPANARITLLEFGDFECPPCGRLSEPLSQLQHEFSSQLRLVFYNFPLPNHKHAREAAWAAEAAGLQGKFWQMHDLLYKDQEVWANSTDAEVLFNAYASYIGLDARKFRIDMVGEEVRQRVAADQKKGTSLGVKNTPTIFVNKREVDPKRLNPTDLHSEIDAALKQGKPSSE
jgi:protein-disulfide isomerase